MKAARHSETLVYYHTTILYHDPEDCDLNRHRSESFKLRIKIIFETQGKSRSVYYITIPPRIKPCISRSTHSDVTPPTARTMLPNGRHIDLLKLLTQWAVSLLFPYPRASWDIDHPHVRIFVRFTTVQSNYCCGNNSFSKFMSQNPRRLKTEYEIPN
jgi:hypothetical protein